MVGERVEMANRWELEAVETRQALQTEHAMGSDYFIRTKG